MLHYSVNHTVIPQERVVIQNPGMEKDESDWNNSRWHGSWIGEQRFFQSVIEGRAEGLREFSGGQVGEIGGGDPLRQAKNEIIVLSVLCSRAAILGGVSEEGALNLEDLTCSASGIPANDAARSASTSAISRPARTSTYSPRAGTAESAASASSIV
ncbi:MAG: hypothetical protein K6E83_13360, partial [Clostridium sp.]|nr:hypothetical protein [Clostridium sp.]